MISLLAPVLAFALQEIPEGTYTHREYKVRFIAPKDWTLKKGESDSILCEGADPKKQLRAWLFTTKAAGETLEADAKLMELVLKVFAWVESSEFQCVKEEKLDRSPGRWMQREYAEKETRLTVRYIRREERLFIIAVRCDASAWDQFRETVGRCLDGFKFLDVKQEPGFRFDPWEAWNSFGVGSTVTTQPDHKGFRTIRTLKEKRENELVVSHYSIMKMDDEEVEFAKGEEIFKKEAEQEASIDCRWCGELMIDHKRPKIEDGTFKIGEREVKTKTVTEYECKGAEKERRVYSPEVPGWFVQGRSTMAISFEAKK